MNTYTYIMTILVWTVCLALTACTTQAADKSQTDKSTADNSSVATQNTNYVTTDSLPLPKAELTKIYTQAIAEFIKGAYKRDKTTFDTLFFGKHVYGQPGDFPDIDLPEIIEHTPVMLVSPEVGQEKQEERKSLIYVNMIGWVDKQQAEFIFIVFSNGAAHQYDYFINFTYNATRKEYELLDIAFENFVNSNGQKPKRITIFKDGQYIGDD